MKKSDLLLSVLFLIVMVILYILGTCEWDLPALILGVVVVIIVALLWRNKKKKEDQNNNSQQTSV